MGLSANTWYAITLPQFTDPVWASWLYPIPSAIVDSIASAVAIPVFCENDFGAGSYAIMHYNGGSCLVPSDGITVVTTPTMDTSSFIGGDTWYSIRYPVGGAWMWYSSGAFLVRQLAAPTTLGAFIA